MKKKLPFNPQTINNSKSTLKEKPTKLLALLQLRLSAHTHTHTPRIYLFIFLT